MKIHSYTDPREGILAYGRWFLSRDGERAAAKAESGRTHGKGIIAKLEGVDDRDAAALWVGAQIEVPRDDLPACEEGSWYWADLIGLGVVNLNGDELGKVTGLLETGANDVLVVQGDRERLIPFVQGRFVRHVDVQGGVIEVDWDRDF